MHSIHSLIFGPQSLAAGAVSRAASQRSFQNFCFRLSRNQLSRSSERAYRAKLKQSWTVALQRSGSGSNPQSTALQKQKLITQWTMIDLLCKCIWEVPQTWQQTPRKNSRSAWSRVGAIPGNLSTKEESVTGEAKDVALADGLGTEQKENVNSMNVGVT